MFVTPSACIATQNKEDIAKVVLMPGDPLRAKTVADTYLKDVVCFNTVRNMLGFTGTYKGRRISVMGSGMGVPSMGLYAHELYAFCGVDAIIRIGSAGGFAEDIELRDIVIAIAASTNSSFPALYGFPGQLAPAANFGLLQTAVGEAQKNGARYKVGQVFTSDQFYIAEESTNQRLKDMGMLAVEMETAGLYVTAMAAGKKALSILTISDHIFTGKVLSVKERQDSFHEMMQISLETAWQEA